MKKRKLLSSVFSVAMATIIAASSPTVGVKLAKEAQLPAEPTVQSVSNSKSVEANKAKSVSAKKETAKTVKIDANNIAQFEDKDDVFYEPEEESISALEDSTTYINDAITVFFSDDATLLDKKKVVKALDGEIVGKVDFMNEYEIKIERSDFYEINNLCDELMENDKVEFASCSLAEKITPDYVPNDPWNLTDWDDDALDRRSLYSNWWIKATDTDKAWDYDEYFSDIDVGIVDTGFDPTHEDLEGKIVFPNEFFEKNNAPSYHGNHVAGIIGATQDNEKGLTGIVRDGKLVCIDWEANEEQGQKWNNSARIMTGFVNAVRAGAKVVNFSLGSSGTIKNGIDRLQIVKDTQGKFNSYYIAKMLQRGYDFICCQSAGNGVYKNDKFAYAVDASNNGTFCPITVDNAVKTVKGVTPQEIVDRIIIVAAAKFTGFNTYEQADFSNGGSQVSICAPGYDIYSTYYKGDGKDYNYCSYAYLKGTSMAAPIVTGIASLVWSVNPSFTGAQVKHFVCDEENTKYEVADSSSELHLPTGTMRMVNAQLAVEAAIKECENYGTVTGRLEWAKITPSKVIDFIITSKETGMVYRLMTDTAGNFNVKLPAGSYTLDLSGKKRNFTVTEGENTDFGHMRTGNATIDFDEFRDSMKDNMQELLSKLQVY
ncbi:peptidase S8 and S53 subtilisin kexin sedolisin [Ruminococcus sp. CAG:563]|nr:peptidase S8 and S53 subtilisin kexin sedolisin [Ruminococcus sp. CAG:563]